MNYLARIYCLRPYCLLYAVGEGCVSMCALVRSPSQVHELFRMTLLHTIPKCVVSCCLASGNDGHKVIFSAKDETCNCCVGRLYSRKLRQANIPRHSLNDMAFRVGAIVNRNSKLNVVCINGHATHLFSS